MPSDRSKRFNNFTLKFDGQLELRYLLGRMDQDLFGFQLLFWVLIITNPAIAIFDLFRLSDPWNSIKSRIYLELILILILVISNRIGKGSAIRLQALFFISSATAYLFLLISDYLIGDGYYQLFVPNITSIILFTNAAFIGLRFRHSLIINVLTLVMYTSYSKWLASRVIYSEQIAHLCVFFLLSTVLSYLFERKNRILFLTTEQISDQKRVIEAKNEELNKQNEIKNTLISILSHDIKSPLNHLQTLLNMKAENFISEQETFKHFEKINRSVENLTQFINHTILWIKTQLKGFHVVIETINVRKEVETITSFCQEELEEKKITIHNTIDHASTLACDKEMFGIVLRNLLINGIKFSHTNTSITIMEDKKNKEYILSIQDHGIGISQEKIKKLFSLDTESSMGTNKEYGTGIGLPLSHNLMKKMGGKLTCDSQEGEGTTFSLTFQL